MSLSSTDVALDRMVRAEDDHENLMKEGKPFEAVMVLLDAHQTGLAYRVIATIPHDALTRRQKHAILRRFVAEELIDEAMRLSSRWGASKTLPQDIRHSFSRRTA